MTEDQLRALKLTMPWQEQLFHTPAGGLLRVIDRNGNEVDMFTMVAFVKLITEKLARGVSEKETSDA